MAYWTKSKQWQYACHIYFTISFNCMLMHFFDFISLTFNLVPCSQNISSMKTKFYINTDFFFFFYKFQWLNVAALSNYLRNCMTFLGLPQFQNERVPGMFHCHEICSYQHLLSSIKICFVGGCWLLILPITERYTGSIRVIFDAVSTQLNWTELVRTKRSI